MNVQPNELGLFEAAAALRNKQISSVELVESCLTRIKAREPNVQAWKHLNHEQALEAASIADQNPGGGPLHGVPIAVKDIIATADAPTGYGSEIYEGQVPQWDASCVALARRAGAIVLGKTVTTEFAYFRPGPTANPHNLLHTPGGSSSGTAAAVADFMVPVGFASQTAASITRPAAFCGVVGYKSSVHAHCLAGVKGLAESLDSLGYIARNVRDIQYMRDALLHRTYAEESTKPDRSVRIGLCKTPSWELADNECRVAFELASDSFLGSDAIVSEIVLPPVFERMVPLQKLIMAYESAQSMAYERDNHLSELSPQILELLEQGDKISSVQYREALNETRGAIELFGRIMRDYEVLVAPSAAGAAPVGLQATGDPEFSRMWTLLQGPCVTLPVLRNADNLPIGIQLVADFGKDDRLLSVARWAADNVLVSVSPPSAYAKHSAGS